MGFLWAEEDLDDHGGADTLTFTAPIDWVRYHKDSGGTAFPGELTPLYYVRIARTENTVVTPPVATCIRIVPTAVLAGSQHLGADQPPLAIIRVTGASALTVVSVATVATARFK